MGVLDDAIRQHIELQRRHGAGEEDLRRQEQEALGPARRESPAPAAEEQAASEVSETPAPDLEAAPDIAVAEEPDEAFDSRRTTVFPALGAEGSDLPGPDGNLPDPEEFHEAPAAAKPEPFAGDEPKADEDVLEETPEFLQETPEHDRLWFEQKPPRDFDFDE